MPWANGRGVSYEIARENDEHGEWKWRLAIAPIDEDGPFSSLPGVHRELTLIDGDGLVLTIDGNMVACRRGEVVRFAGYSHTHAALAHGPVVDLNVMSREETPMSMTIVAAPSEIRNYRCIVAIDECTLVVEGETFTLGPRDALVDDASIVRLDSGAAAVITPAN
jgi:uncharacterized protein